MQNLAQLQENEVMKVQEIYQEIGELLWSIMSQELSVIYFTGDIYPSHYSGGSHWLSKTGEYETFEYLKGPDEIERKIQKLMKELQSLDIFKDKWTNYKITLTAEGGFKTEFAYVPEEDYWPNLYMRGISDLEESEIDKYNVPYEIWKECLKLKSQNTHK